MKHFKIYGCKRSGTNYLAALLQQNFDDTKTFMNLGGWKHGPFLEFPTVQELYRSVDHPTRMGCIKETGKLMDLFKNQEVTFFACCKNPYTWVLSYCKDEEIEFNDQNIYRSLLVWNQTYNNYRPHIESGKMHLVKYEDVLQDMGGFLTKLMNKYSLKRKSNLNDFIGVEKHLKPNADSEIGQTYDNKFVRHEHYINPDMLKLFTKDQIILINRCLSHEIMNLLGYSYVSV